jgi:hypothetical protein
MRVLFSVLILLVLGLLAEGIFDSAIGAWVAFGALMSIVALRLLGWVGLWPADWPDLFGDDGLIAFA